MPIRYKKIHQKQRDLQNKIDIKISNEIYDVQQVLEVLVKQSQSQGQGTDDFIQCTENIKETNKREKQQGQVNSNIIYI